jgi:hypothetical protein
MNNRSSWIASMVAKHGWTIGAELGLCNGKTFLYLLNNCKNLTMIGVDLWAEQPDNDGPENYVGCDHTKRELTVRCEAKRFGSRAIIIKDWTSNAAKQVEDKSLDFVFIDADHSSEGVRADIIDWYPKVKDSGWILGHDINWPTVSAVVNDLLPGYIIGDEHHLSLPHEFICITESDLPGWWGKVRLFGENSRERNLWFDLDVVITGPLDGLCERVDNDIRTAKNWAQSGWGGCQSSVMYWEGDNGRVINDTFDPAIAHWPPRNDGNTLWGDQEWITHLRDKGVINPSYFDTKDVVSYKYHCRGKDRYPAGAKVVAFHGRPKPYEVNEAWVREARSCGGDRSWVTSGSPM